MSPIRALLAAALTLGATAAVSSPAAAEPPCGRGWRSAEYCGPRWHDRAYRPRYRERVIVAPPPVVYVRPRVYAPPPVYVAPTYIPPGNVPPVYAPPPPSLGANIPLR